ncbi:hypothetical protein J22TS1_01750 [Siminovitchia terrae]|uniref:hypothetical protein n=1 Tax=Siminovitchia terrae TaxID=1914933 RepID=UPI001B09B0B9|nr:hypothetical protein [Siminovitchia terrae]GIN89124.1 hypothetical protein J22TS1_01750 [Siminovitchia terrae]
MSKKQLLEYLPFLIPLIPLLVAFIVYSLGRRGHRINKLYSQIENNLTNACGPMYFNLKRICELGTESQINYEIENRLENFFSKFSSVKFPIHQLGNLAVLELFIKTEKEYHSFIESPTKEHWEQLKKSLHDLKNELDREYYANFETLYKDYLWDRKHVEGNFFIRMFFELMKFVKETVNFLTVCSLLFVYFAIWDYYFIKIFPIGSVSLSLVVLCLCIGANGVMFMFNGFFHEHSNRRNSFLGGLKKLIKRLFKKIIQFFKALKGGEK